MGLGEVRLPQLRGQRRQSVEGSCKVRVCEKCVVGTDVPELKGMYCIGNGGKYGRGETF